MRNLTRTANNKPTSTASTNNLTCAWPFPFFASLVLFWRRFWEYSVRICALLGGSVHLLLRNDDRAGEPKVKRCAMRLCVVKGMLTDSSQDESAQLATAVARRSPPKLTVRTSQIRTAA